MPSIITKDGDMVDALVLAYYGAISSRTTARVFNANPELCEQPARLPAGIRIELPDNTLAASMDNEVKLWD